MEEDNSPYRERFRKLQSFKPQQTALSGGSLLMFNSGIHIGYGFYHWKNSSVAWTKDTSTTLIALAVVAWFVGSLVGFVLAPLSLKLLSKKLIYLLANSLVLSVALLFTAFPQFYYSVLSGRFIAGVGYGLAYVVLIQHYGEITSRELRGRVGTSIHLFLLKGGIISGTAVISFFSVEGRMDINRFLGIMSLVLGAIAILMTAIFYKESPVALIQMGKDDVAVRNIMLLRGESEETPETKKIFNDFKAMLAEDSDSSIFSDGNSRPLVIVLLLRVAFVLTFNYAIKYIHVTMTHNSKSGIDYTFILNLVHTFTVVFVMFTIDKGSKRKHFLTSAFGTVVILIIFGALRVSIFSESDILVFIMFVCFELFSAIGMGLASNIFSTEAFPTAKKTQSIAFTCIFESCLQILMVVWVENIVYSSTFDVILLFTTGTILAAITGYLYFNLPETGNLSIREARYEFVSRKRQLMLMKI